MTVAPTGFPLRGRIRLNQLLNNVRVNRNTEFKRLELLPFKTDFQIQNKNATSPTENGHCSKWVPYPLDNFGQSVIMLDFSRRVNTCS